MLTESVQENDGFSFPEYPSGEVIALVERVSHIVVICQIKED
jgi:hypothetical protein